MRGNVHTDKAATTWQGRFWVVFPRVLERSVDIVFHVIGIILKNVNDTILAVSLIKQQSDKRLVV
jgi:hypothetical protein